MLPHELEKVLDRIAWGKRYARIKDKTGKQRIIILKSLDLRDRNFIDFIHSESLSEAIKDGVLTETELKKELELRYIWGPPQEEELSSIEEKIKKTTELIENARNARDERRLENALENLEKKRGSLLADKAALFSNSAEKYADIWKMYAIIFCMAHTDKEEKLWPTWDDFLNEIDQESISEVISRINEGRTAQTREIRKLARSGLWRTMWNAGAKCGDLFGKPIIHLDSEQQSLVYWSQVYDSVYEAYERPSDEIIDDDEKLDKWFEEQAKKNDKKKKKKKDEGPLGISKKVARHGEVFVVVGEQVRPTNGPPIKPKTIEDVASLNSPETQNWKNRQFETIKNKGVISEKELRPRGDRESRGLIGASDAVLGKMRRTKRGMTRDVIDRRPGGTL